MMEKIRKVFLDDLPRKNGVANKINWLVSIGYKIRFVYDNIEGEIKVISYNKSNHEVVIKYLNNEYKIKTDSIIHCNLGKLLGKYTVNFKVSINTIFVDDKRDITIIGREYRMNIDKDNYKCKDKYYKYHCNKCGNEDWIKEGNVITQGCNTCCASPKKIVLGINTIWDKARWMCDLGVSEEDAKTYTHSSNKEITITCPNCKKEKEVKPNVIYQSHSIGCTCSDKIPYGEKVMSAILGELGMNFKTQLSKTTYNWVGSYYYDFYIPSLNIIIETHGIQHYENSFQKIKSSSKIKSLEEEQVNDKNKQELAITNGVKEENYIIIDCRKSELEFIKQNIIDSNFGKLFDLSIIDWNKVQKFALSNRVKVACDYKKNNPNLTTTQIGNMMNIDGQTIRKYLKQGQLLGWCLYSVKEEIRRASSKSGKMSGKSVEIFKEGISMGVFSSATELGRQSEELFGVKLLQCKISAVCLGDRKKHKGFTFTFENKI